MSGSKKICLGGGPQIFKSSKYFTEGRMDLPQEDPKLLEEGPYQYY